MAYSWGAWLNEERPVSLLLTTWQRLRHNLSSDGHHIPSKESIWHRFVTQWREIFALVTCRSHSVLNLILNWSVFIHEIIWAKEQDRRTNDDTCAINKWKWNVLKCIILSPWSRGHNKHHVFFLLQLFVKFRWQYDVNIMALLHRNECVFHVYNHYLGLGTPP